MRPRISKPKCIYSTNVTGLSGYKQLQIEVSNLKLKRINHEQRNKSKQTDQITKFTTKYAKHVKRVSRTERTTNSENANVLIFSF